MIPITPEKRVVAVLASLESSFREARLKLSAGNKKSMYNWVECGMKQIIPLVESLDIMEDERKTLLNILRPKEN